MDGGEDFVKRDKLRRKRRGEGFLLTRYQWRSFGAPLYVSFVVVPSAAAFEPVEIDFLVVQKRIRLERQK